MSNTKRVPTTKKSYFLVSATVYISLVFEVKFVVVGSK